MALSAKDTSIERQCAAKCATEIVCALIAAGKCGAEFEAAYETAYNTALKMITARQAGPVQTEGAQTATPKQVALIRTLLKEWNAPADEKRAYAVEMAGTDDIESMTLAGASRLITGLKAKIQARRASAGATGDHSGDPFEGE